MPTTSPYNDKELLARIAQGDEHAFKQLFINYSRLLYPFVTKLVKQEGVAEEMIQQVFLKLWLNRDKLADVEHPSAYIYQIASNECFAFLRKQAIANKHLAQLGQKQGSNSIESHLSFVEIKRLVHTAYLQLPPQQQRIFYLSRHHHLSIPDVAAQLNISPTTVKNSLVKSLKAIRQFLEREGYYLPLLLIFSNFFWV